MFVQLASDPLPYAPHNLEQAQYGLGVLIVLLVAVMCFGGGRKAKAAAKPVRAKASNGTGVALLVVALLLFGKSHDSVEPSKPEPRQPHSTATPSAKPGSGSTHCSLICFQPKN